MIDSIDDVAQSPDGSPLCRVCGSVLTDKPVLFFSGMPSGAQAFPDAVELPNDQGTDLTVDQCLDCGMVQLVGRPVPYYRDVIRAAAFSSQMIDFRRQQFRHFVNENGLVSKKLIEVGCGRGEYLRLMQDAGVSAYGIEHGPTAVDACRNDGLEVQQGFIDAPSQCLDLAPFDAFMILNFLEHLPQPVSTLRGIAANLANGAVGLVEVPNLDMIFRRRLFTEFIADHLLYFTRDTFCQTLALGGFEIVNCKAVWHEYILSALVRKRHQMDLSGFQAAREQLQRDLRAFIKRLPPRSVSVWGAGHQALATIALTGIGPDLKYVIDSAPFKQNKFTPATHIPIVAPDVLKTDPPSSILVMAASYTDEVVSIIKESPWWQPGRFVVRLNGSHLAIEEYPDG